MAVDIAQLAEKLCKMKRDVIFLGDGVPVYQHRLTEILMAPHAAAGFRHWYAPAHLNKQRAGAVGALALQYLLRNERIQTAAEHQPVYLRMAQAERERVKRENAAKGQPPEENAT